MADSNDNLDQKPDGKITSRSTRRIVVEDLPVEETPEVRGRKLISPTDNNADSSYSSSRPRTARESERPIIPNTASRASRSRTASTYLVDDAYPALAGSAVSRDRGIKRHGKETVNVRRLSFIIAAMIALPLAVSAIILVLGSRSRKLRQSQPATSLVADSREPTRATAALPEPKAATPSEVPASDNPSGPAELDQAEIRAMVVQLASQISQKSGYEFAPDFVELIRSRAHEYNSAKALISARQYRREINKSFRDEGLNPLIGYTLAMSRSKFDPELTDKGIGLWQLPLAVARSQGYIGSTESSAKLKVPATSAQISASYAKQLLSAFDNEDFMYAIACFGMNLQDAGRLQARLVNVAPDSRSRRDIMKMIKAGVLNDEQVENIARFFAAGIVGEHPQKFSLAVPQPFSDL